jgi:hypothetical protein
MVVPVELRGEAELAQVGQAPGTVGRRPGPAKGRQQETGKHRNQRDHDEQFHQRETGRTGPVTGAN